MLYNKKKETKETEQGTKQRTTGSPRTRRITHDPKGTRRFGKATGKAKNRRFFPAKEKFPVEKKFLSQKKETDTQKLTGDPSLFIYSVFWS
jgi:hypothetical protein